MDGCVCTWWAGEGSRRRLGGWKGGQPLPGSGWVDPAPCAKASSSPSLLPGSLPTTPSLECTCAFVVPGCRGRCEGGDSPGLPLQDPPCRLCGRLPAPCMPSLQPWAGAFLLFGGVIGRQ